MPHYSWKGIDPGVVYANRLACEPGFVFGPRVIQDHQFIYIIKGEGKATIQDRMYRVKSGDLIYYGPDIVHQFQADARDPFVVYGLHFSLFRTSAQEKIYSPAGIRAANFDEHTELKNELILGESKESFILVPEFGCPGNWIEHYFSHLVKLHQTRDDISYIQSRAAFTELLVKLAQWVRQERNINNQQAETALQVRKQLQQHAAKAYDRKWLYQWTSYHENHAARLFHAQFGISPHEYHQQEKLFLAQKLLRETNLPIGKIATKLHFSNIHYFSRWFRTGTGMTATAYRLMNRFI